MTTLDTRDGFSIELNGVKYEIDLTRYRRQTIEATRAQQDHTRPIAPTTRSPAAECAPLDFSAPKARFSRMFPPSRSPPSSRALCWRTLFLPACSSAASG